MAFKHAVCDENSKERFVIKSTGLRTSSGDAPLCRIRSNSSMFRRVDDKTELKLEYEASIKSQGENPSSFVTLR